MQPFRGEVELVTRTRQSKMCSNLYNCDVYLFQLCRCVRFSTVPLIDLQVES